MIAPLHFLVRPVPATEIEAPDRRRIARSGPRVDDPRTVQLRSGKTALGMTTRQMAQTLSAADGIRTSPETLQAYMQGYIASDEMIDAMLARVLALTGQQSPQTRRFTDRSMVEIMDEWFGHLQLPADGPDSRWRTLARILQKDHSTLFRWYQQNRKPRSVDTLVAMDRALHAHLAGCGRTDAPLL